MERRSHRIAGQHASITGLRGNLISVDNATSALLIDVRKARAIDAYATGCTFYEGVSASGHTAFTQCDDGRTSELIGFRRVIPAQEALTDKKTSVIDAGANRRR